jgi:hypothetical protein
MKSYAVMAGMKDGNPDASAVLFSASAGRALDLVDQAYEMKFDWAVAYQFDGDKVTTIDYYPRTYTPFEEKAYNTLLQSAVRFV